MLQTMPRPLPRGARGRGTDANPSGRFERLRRGPIEDAPDDIEGDDFRTEVGFEAARTALAQNASPDLPFDRSLNPYRGCEHGCVYCYARPTHNYLGFSSGLDFERRLVAKTNLAEVLRAELAKPGYAPAPIALGTATDPYQPVERRLRITRRVLEVLAEARHPVGIVTKSALVARDLDLLASMAETGTVRVMVSLNSLDKALIRRLEPRAAAPHKRLETIEALAKAGVPVGVSLAPVIPGLTDEAIENVLRAAADAGATSAAATLLRLPHDVEALFVRHLDLYHPLKKDRVLALVRACRGGALNDPNFGDRMTGTGRYAAFIRQRFAKARRRLGLEDAPPLRTDLFRRPARNEAQLDMFA